MKKNNKFIAAFICAFTIIILWVYNGLDYNSIEKNGDPSPEKIVQLMGTETSFGVKGNCTMCKTTIETAANSLDGVLKADWNVQTKQLSLVYDSQIVELIRVHEAIANSGYGTELVENNMDSYENLPLCCKYDPAMNVKSN